MTTPRTATPFELGGRLLMDPKDAAGGTAWAVLEDPNGAAFGLVPVVPSDALPNVDAAGSPGVGGAIGRVAWLDLTVRDAFRTRDDYRQVVGWSVQAVEMAEETDRYADSNLVREDGEPAAGVCHARGTNADLPPVWHIYLPVGDLDESLRRVEAEGGTVLKVSRRADGRPLYAAVREPVGACFALVPG
ncbi:MAG: VOC family protein [Trueperaceae bacterium]